MANPIKKIQIKSESTIRIKTEPGTSDVERLASFKLPRDLTLGGSAHRAKRTFTPNLNIVRNKNKSNEPTASTSAPSTRGGRGGRGRGTDNRGRGGRGRGKEFIQSQGVFSEGIGDRRKQTSWGGRSSGGGGGGTRDDSANAIEKPKVDFKQEIKYDKNEEDQRLEDIFSKKGNYSNLEPDYEYAPITLPYRVPEIDKSDIKKSDNNSFNILTKIKQEPISQANNLKDLLESEKQKYIFFQFPDSLPAFGSTIESETPTIKVDKKTLNPSITTENNSVPSRCTLNDLSEGIVGKIVIYKSGRAKLILGSTEFNLELGMQRSFLQDVMSIETNSEKNDGKMINLGQIDGDIVVTPDWNYLLNNAMTVQ